MTDPVFKYLVVHPVDLGGGALGASSRVGSFDVDAYADRLVEYNNSAYIYPDAPLDDPVQYGAGGVAFKVPVADDPAITNGSGVQVYVAVTLTLHGEMAKRQIPAKLVRVLTSSVDLAAGAPDNTLGADVVYLSSLPDQSPTTASDGTPLPPSWGHGAPAGTAPDGFLYGDLDTGDIYQYNS